MANAREQLRQQFLADMGLGRTGVKIGSKLVPLVLLVVAAIIFMVANIATGREFLAEHFATFCQTARTKAEHPVPSAAGSTGSRSAPAPSASTDVAPLGTATSAQSEPPAAASRAASRALMRADRSAAPAKREVTGLVAECLKPAEPRKDIATLKASFAALKMSAMADELTHFEFDEIGRWYGLWRMGKAFLKTYLDDLAVAFRDHTSDVAKAVGLAAIYSLVPGIAGSIYRRAFWTWFGVSFVLLLLIKSWTKVPPITQASAVEEAGTLFGLIVSQIVVLLLANRLRRYSSSMTTLVPAGIFNKGLALLLYAAAFVVGWYDYGATLWTYFAGGSWPLEVLYKWEFILVGLPLVYTLLRQSVPWSGRQTKNIVVCLDGTSNTPDQYELGQLAQTNVFKLFRMLKSDGTKNAIAPGAFDASLTKRYQDKQIAFYYVGVGNQIEYSPILQTLGQAMGLGASSVVDRAYLDIMRVYQPGDKLFIFGFSRGAAIARLLARAIDQRGAPRSLWTVRLFGRHWTVRKSKPLTGEDGRVPITVLGCWDTVGAFGIAKKIMGIDFQKIDLFKDLSVPDNVEQAYHMVALDEQRDSFVPTLMDPDPIKPGRIVEVWFSGDHANIGGGWATPKLSDITLDFLLRHVSSGYAADPSKTPGDETWGLYLNAVANSALSRSLPVTPDTTVVAPDHLGQLRQWTSLLYTYQPRKLPLHAVISDSVFKRMTGASPVYAPQSLFDLNDDLEEKRETVTAAVARLGETRSLDEIERQNILEYKDKLQLTRWSQYIQALQMDGEAPSPAVKLENKPRATGTDTAMAA